MARNILRGDVELRRALKAIPAATTLGLDGAMRESLEPMRKQTSLNALRLRKPGRQPPGGHLDQGVVIRKIDNPARNVRTFWVSFTKRARYLAHLVEFGTAPHWQPNRRQMHPGARPKPFATPAFESTKSEVVAGLGKRTWSLIAGAASRFGRRTK